jgi:glycosyltransferase involved in cell wall biosynthesis
LSPKIALFTPYLPAPAHSGGRIRMHRFAEAMAKRFEVHLFASAALYEIRRHLSSPELAMYASVNVAWGVVDFLPALRRPSRVRAASPGKLERAFRRSDRQRRFEAAVAEHSHAAWIPESARPLPWVLDEHNVESDYVEAKIRSAGRAPNVVQRREIRALRRWEERLWTDANEVVCVSNDEARRVEGVRGRSAVVIPNGAAIAEVPFKRPSARDGYDILFVGILEHPPNVEAARFIVTEILPRVAAIEPRARVVLCGARPSRDVLALASDRVTVTGSVPSVVPYLERAAVYANPLRQGAGTSLKVLEALASGVPLVSTAVGVRGFSLSSPEHFLLADDAAGFARHIATCFRERDARDHAAEAGRRFAERYDWAVLASEFAEVVDRVARVAPRNGAK